VGIRVAYLIGVKFGNSIPIFQEVMTFSKLAFKKNDEKSMRAYPDSTLPRWYATRIPTTLIDYLFIHLRLYIQYNFKLLRYSISDIFLYYSFNFQHFSKIPPPRPGRQRRNSEESVRGSDKRQLLRQGRSLSPNRHDSGPVTDNQTAAGSAAAESETPPINIHKKKTKRGKNCGGKRPSKDAPPTEGNENNFP
jgi:hypothetical protein